MGRPFIIYVNLSDILKDQKETHYTMYIDDTKMSIVLELVEWIRWIFSLTRCVYVTHENSVIHELEDIKILSVLRTVKVQNCYHFPCVHTNFNYLYKKLSLFAQWDGIEVPKLFLNKVNEISQKFIQKDSGIEVMINGHNEKETTTSNERQVESHNVKEWYSSNSNTCENQLSKNSTNNMYSTNKTNFNINSSIKLDETVVKTDNSDKVHSILSAKSESAHVNSIKNSNFVGLDKKPHDTTIPTDTAVDMKNWNKVQSVLPDENKFVNAPIEISESEIEQIKSLVDINLSANTKYNEDKETNKSNQKGIESLTHDKKLNCNKIIKKDPKPFSVGEILTNLRSEFNTSSKNCEPNTFFTEHSQNNLDSNGLINDRLEGSDRNSPNDIDVLVTKIKRKRIRRHKPKRLMSRGPRFDNLPKHEGGYTSESFTSYTPYHTKQSSHIRFTSDDEDFSETTNCELDKQPEKTQHDLSKNNESLENRMQPSSLVNGKEEAFSVTPPNVCNKNDESKVEDSSEANKEFSTLDKLMLLHDQKSSLDSLYGFLSEENLQTNGEAKTSDNFDFNLSTLKALKEKFPSPMVVERFY